MVRVFMQNMSNYLKNNATIDTYTEHPKISILDEFLRESNI